MSEFGPEAKPTEQSAEEPTVEQQPIAEATTEASELHQQMNKIVDQVERGEPLTVELYTAYQMTSEQLVDQTAEDLTLNVHQHTFACAYLKLLGGEEEAALEDLTELAEVAGYGDYDEVVTHAENLIAEIRASQEN
ncbi:MAG TPA: hypothetical protein VMQ44_00835 [Candidatus Saccharimonadales bacterium]|nr:hypothetical protein [Candidatus Saccharimonadales bacterium]